MIDDVAIVPKYVNSPNTTRSPILCLRDILIQEMTLDPSRVNLYNQKFKLPTDEDLFIVIAHTASKAYRVKNDATVNSNFYDCQYLNVHEIYDISILSRSDEAYFRKEEVLMALASQYAQQVQEQYAFQIARIPSGFNDVSEVEGAARLYRYVISVPVLAWYSKQRTQNYYDTFNGAVSTESIPDVPFSIDTNP